MTFDPSKTFKLKTPCDQCPFLKGSSFASTLMSGRIEEIALAAIQGDNSAFHCHKTLSSPIPQQCAGIASTLKKSGYKMLVQAYSESTNIISTDHYPDSNDELTIHLDDLSLKTKSLSQDDATE